eukprot:3291103-Amphidinium_carterae.1
MEQPHLPLPQPLPVHSLPDLPSQSVHYGEADPVDVSISLGHINEAFEQWCVAWENFLIQQCPSSTIQESHHGRGLCELPRWKAPSAITKPV